MSSKPAETSKQKRITVPSLTAMKANGEKITLLTAYDYSMARLVDEAGVEVILVGDSLGTAVQGHRTTLPVTLDQMIYHAEMVVRAVERALVIVDLPFPCTVLGPMRAIEDAARCFKETGCQAVKLEGGVERAEVISALTKAGMPVMAHVGLVPQSVHRLGGYRVQRDRDQLIADAKATEEAGAFAVVLECISADISKEITAELTIPTIGIGAGNGCDGQVLVLYDLLGLIPGRVPRHVKVYADLGKIMVEAVSAYKADVRSGDFPSSDQSFS
ncbi:MAG: 3-methyl-2-oxobutanoate hydroxymethyltransferase [Pirellulales bacterium]|nr:3-methyl-2-oxobutanoate hydroxymethyltransferase [Pirellulales bacterium]